MENKKGIITFPSVYMHTSPDAASEVSDEILYGTEIRKIAASGSWYRCETSYGYSGYIHSRFISSKENITDAFPFIVITPFADLYEEPVYRYRPIITLPKGSIIYSPQPNGGDDRFFPVIHRGKKCFIPSNSVKPFETVKKIDTSEVNLLRKKICDDALMYLGTPYRWGGKAPSGIDCSGLCFMSYFLNGLPLWRDAYADKRYVHEISESSAKQGDLIYFKGHVAMYIGDGEYVHSSASAGLVTVNSLYKSSIIYRADLADKFICFARSNLL